MKQRDVLALMDGIAPAVASLIGKGMIPFIERLQAIDAQLAKFAELFKAAPTEADIAAQIELIVEKAIADLPKAAVGVIPRSPTAADVAVLMPLPKDGRDADPDVIKSMVADAVAALPAPASGKDADPDVIKAMVKDAIANLVAQLHATVDVVIAEVSSTSIVAINEVKSAVPSASEVAALIPSLTVEDLRPLVDLAVSKAVEQIRIPADGEPGKDGVGLAAALKDHEGCLVLTLTDGTIVKLGRVDGERGLGFDDIEVIDDSIAVTWRLARGDQVKEWTLAKPTLADFYRGVWREGAYKKGDACTWGGSLFIAQVDTTTKPESGEEWKLAVKRGRDGKDGIAPKPAAQVKLK